MRHTPGTFLLGVLVTLNVQGLVTDIAGRERTLAYLNDPTAWVESAISAPIHLVAIAACLLLLATRKAKA